MLESILIHSSLLDLLFLFVVIAWIVLSIIHQLNFRISLHINKLDVFKLIPIWTFFSPIPGTKDYTLVCRYHDKPDEWLSVVNTKDRGIFSFLFNSMKLENKCLVDLVNSLVLIANNTKATGNALESYINLSISTPYLNLLNVVSDFNRDIIKSESKFQFAILSSNAYVNYNKGQACI